MHHLIQLKTTPPLLVTVALLCFGLSPTAKALLPAPSPDGGYPGGNTAEGINALHDVNTAVGINNTAVGLNALTHDTTGQYNVAVGSGALENNTTGDFNMAIGTEALQQNNASFNLAIGFRVGFMNTTGRHLTGIGAAALRNNTTASFNTAIGADALRENTTGEDNTAIGADALSTNTTGSNNTATGRSALNSNTRGNLNTANGLSALYSNTTGIGNTAEGGDALFSNTTGGGNTAIGEGALSSNTIGNVNIAVGAFAGHARTTGNNNIDIGNTSAVAAESNAIRIGNFLHTATYIAGILGNGPFSCSVSIDPVTGQLGVGGCISSERFKKDIDSMDDASEAIFSFKPVTFHYKNDKTNVPQFGLIAEEVAKVNPALIAVDKEGKPYSVRYEAVNAMLLNEFLKEHRRGEEQDCKIQEQEKMIAELRSEIRNLAAVVNEQASELRNVSAQLQISDDAAQEIASNRP